MRSVFLVFKCVVMLLFFVCLSWYTTKNFKREMIERRKDKRAKSVGERPSRDVTLLRDEPPFWNFGKEEGWLV
jgi:hypothetical protein